MNLKIIKVIPRILMIFLVGLNLTAHGFSTPSEEQRALAGFDKERLEVFADDFFKRSQAEEHIPGAVFVLVKNRDILLKKGYGFADLERKIPADPDISIFRAGSNAKLLTAMAALQVSDRGLADLNADIDTILKSIKIKRRFPQPVTLRRLLTHTSGFDDRFLTQHVRRQEDLMPFGPYLEKRMPLQIVPPGRIIIYSDFGMALAGFVVQEVTGMPYEEFIRVNIFEPLEMASSDFIPGPDHMKRMAVGYKFKRGRFESYPYDYLQIPAGSGFNTTAADMAHFIATVLNGGFYNDRRILRQETAEEFLSQQFIHHASLSGMAYGFEEYESNNRTFLIKAGAAAGFECLMAVFPEEKVAFWLAYNRSSGFYWRFLVDFMDRFFPAEKKAELPPEAALKKIDLRPYLGYYRHLPYSVNTFQKVASLTEQVRITKNGNFLRAFGADFYAVERLVFRRAYDTRHIAFLAEKKRIKYVFFGKSGYEKLSVFATRPAQASLLAIFGLFFLVPLPLAVFGYPKKSFRRTRPEYWIRWGIAGIGGLNLVFLGVIAVELMNLDPWDFSYGIPLALKIWLAVPVLTGVAALAASALIRLMWRRKLFTTAARLLYTYAWLAALLFIIFLNSWNLLGWQD